MSRYELWNLFGPSTWAVWFLLIAAAILLIRGRRGFALMRAALLAGAALALVTAVLPTGYVLMERLETRFPVVPIAAARGTDIVVLAGGEKLMAAFRSGQPQYSEHNERVTEGAMLARALPRARLWAVGGVQRPPGAPYDVDWAIASWTALGVPVARIRRIADTADTCTNALGIARRVAPAARIILVTSSFHMPRAVACFRAAGIAVLPYPVDFQNGPWSPAELQPDVAGNLRRFDLALHEYAGLLWYRLYGRTDMLWPGPLARTASQAQTAGHDG